MRKIINAPSLANCTFLKMKDQLNALHAGNVDWFHYDIMDGHYVPNLCFSVPFIKELRQFYPSIEVDVHLMVTNPSDYLEQLALAGAGWVSFHTDATRFVRRTISDIKKLGMKAGVVINPSQPISSLEPYLPFVDYVVLMTVEPGYAGQKFMVDSLDRLATLVSLRSELSLDFLISIDGGVDNENAVKCVQMGAEVFVTGIYTVFNQEDGITNACHRFIKMLENA